MKPNHLILAACVAALTAVVGIAAAGARAPFEKAGSAQEETFTPHVVTAEDIPAGIHEDSRARVPRITSESLDADGQRAYDVIVNPDSRYATGLRGPIGMWMNSPLMAEHLFPASSYLRFGADGNRDQRLAELAILTAARALNSHTSGPPTSPRTGTRGSRRRSSSCPGGTLRWPTPASCRG